MLISFALAVAQVAIGQNFTCDVVRVHDGDGPLTCSSGVKVRIAGVQAPDFEDAEPCRTGKAGYVCDDGQARAAQRITAGLVLGKRLTCTAVDHSWNRTVARCWLPDKRSLSCAVVARGAARRWPAYWRRYRMGDCK